MYYLLQPLLFSSDQTKQKEMPSAYNSGIYSINHIESKIDLYSFAEQSFGF